MTCRSRVNPWVLLLALAPFTIACAEDEPSPPPSGGTDGVDEPGVITPDSDGHECDQPGVAGWKLPCRMWPSHAYYGETHLDIAEEGQFLNELAPGAGACCGGCPTEVVADLACEAQCVEYACNELKELHDQQNQTFLCSDCEFDMDACLTGLPYDQKRAWFTFVGVSILCNAAAQVGIDGEGCLELGTDAEPELCEVPTGADLRPGMPAQYSARDDAGTRAELTWTFAGSTADAATAEVDVNLDYRVEQCDQASEECVRILALRAAIPDRDVYGVRLSDVSLIAEFSSGTFELSRGSDFEIPAKVLRATLSFIADGARYGLTARNTGTTRGSLSPATGALTLAPLVFRYEDPIINGELQLDLSGAYVARPPTASIAVASQPGDCAEPVAFVARSTDADGDAMSHIWATELGEVGSGNLFEVVLASGEHEIRLSSVDAGGRRGSTLLRYHRRCR